MNRRLAAAAILLLLGAFPGCAQAPPPPGTRLLLTFLGDLMAHRVNFQAPDFSAIYRPVRPLLERDALTFANLETPVDSSREYSTYPRFNVASPYLQAAVEAGIDVFSLANNHAFDQGFPGIAATQQALEEAGRRCFRKVHWAGTRTDPGVPFRPVLIQVEGLRIGLLAATQTLNDRQQEPWVLQADYGIPEQADAFVEAVRAEAPRFDLFVVSYHGGREYAREPERSRVRFFRRLLEAGADIVWGHHPHVLQGFEWVQRPEGRGLLLYSTGNFLSGMTWGIDPAQPEAERAWTGDSVLWGVSVGAGQEGRVEVLELWPVPVTNVRDPGGNVAVSTFPALAGRGLDESWAAYYRERSRLLTAWLREQAFASVDPD